MIFEIDNILSLTDSVVLPFPEGAEIALEKLRKYTENGKKLVVEIKLKRQRRSLNANAALWAMLRDMSAVLKTTDEELYLVALQKYGVSEYIACVPEAVERVSNLYRLVVNRGSCCINGNRVTCLQVFPGSSTYNTQEFSVLLDGVIQDAKELGVDFISKADRDLLLREREESKEYA